MSWIRRRPWCATCLRATATIPATCRRNGSEGLDGFEEAVRARRIADFIAGMTDRFALAEHARLFDSTPELR